MHGDSCGWCVGEVAAFAHGHVGTRGRWISRMLADVMFG